MPAPQVELAPYSALSQRVDGLMHVYETSPIPERRLAFREALVGYMRGVFIDLHTPTQALYSRVITKMSELPLTNPGAPDPVEFELQSEVGAEMSLLSSVLTGEGSILTASSPLGASAASNGIDPFNEYFLTEVSADHAGLANVTPADAMEAIDFAAAMLLHDIGNDQKYTDPAHTVLNENYGKITRGFGTLFQKGFDGFREKLNVAGLHGDARNIEYIYWTGALLYLAGMVPSQKWGMVDGRYGFTFPVSRLRPDLTLRGGSKVRPYFKERSDQLVLPGAHALDFYTWKMVKGDANLDPDETPVKSIDVALKDDYLLKANVLKANFTGYIPKDLGTHWGKYVKDLMSLSPDTIQLLGDDPAAFFQKAAKEPTLIEVSKPIRMAYYLEFAKLAFEWNLPPNPDKTHLYHGRGPIVGQDKVTGVKPASYSRQDIKQQLLTLAEMGLLDSGLPPRQQKNELSRVADEYYNALVSGSKDATEVIFKAVAKFGVGAAVSVAKAIASSK